MTAPPANPFAYDTPTTAATAPATAPLPPTAPAPVTDDGDPFSGPAPQEARGPRLREMYGRLLLIIPHKLEEGIPNRLDPRGGTQDRMTADVVILDGGSVSYGGKPEATPPKPHTKVAGTPHKNSRMFISAVGMISQCREALAKKIRSGQPGMVLGRLSVGEAKGDQNPPYMLTPPTDADKAVARAYLATVDPFA